MKNLQWCDNSVTSLIEFGSVYGTLSNKNLSVEARCGNSGPEISRQWSGSQQSCLPSEEIRLIIARIVPTPPSPVLNSANIFH